MSPAQQNEQTKVYILGGAAVIGGITLGWAASQGWVNEAEAFKREPTTSEGVGTWVAFNVGLVILGSSLLEVVEEYGIAKVAGFGIGIPAAALLVRALR